MPFGHQRLQHQVEEGLARPLTRYNHVAFLTPGCFQKKASDPTKALTITALQLIHMLVQCSDTSHPALPPKCHLAVTRPEDEKGRGGGCPVGTPRPQVQPIPAPQRLENCSSFPCGKRLWRHSRKALSPFPIVFPARHGQAAGGSGGPSTALAPRDAPHCPLPLWQREAGQVWGRTEPPLPSCLLLECGCEIMEVAGSAARSLAAADNTVAFPAISFVWD